tara:strand:+ start:1263 stop:1634 length:372 start_codon:yes stop_codon:yes gene_type:complete
MTAIEQKLDDINNKLDVLITKMLPLMDILQVVIKNNISNETIENSPKKEVPELAFKVEPIRDNIVRRNLHIFGKKTFENKDIIKAKFSNAIWSKETNSWVIEYVFGIEEEINKLFPNIIQMEY